MEQMFRARIVAGGESVERVWPLTPYEVEVIIEDALRSGREARLELVMPAGGDASSLWEARRHFRRLAARGVRVEFLHGAEL